MQSRWRFFLSLLGLFIFLTIADDMVWAWVFAIISQFSKPISVVMAFFGSWVYGYIWMRMGLRLDKTRLGAKLDKWLRVKKHPDREGVVKAPLALWWAVPLTLFVGGAITVLIFYYRGKITEEGAKKLGVALCGLYAVEFASLWGLGFGSLFSFVVDSWG